MANFQVQYKTGTEEHPMWTNKTAFVQSSPAINWAMKHGSEGRVRVLEFANVWHTEGEVIWPRKVEVMVEQKEPGAIQQEAISAEAPVQ